LKRADVLVLFGATGDLAKKKLFPALYEMEEAGELEIPVFAVASSQWSQDEFKTQVEKSIREKKIVAGGHVNEKVLSGLLDEMQLVVGDYKDQETFEKLKIALNGYELPVVYLAISPGMFADVSKGLNSVGLTTSARVVVEKPFGRDLASAIALDDSLKKLLPENQIYRIDHYLGKESVEDLLVFRFANTLFEPVWNRNYISNIQITMTEDFGIEGRGKFYDAVGATRDVLQNHLLQVLTMLTMEPPIDMSAASLQN
jgi:glucose-6-phosphate 1-dehydrogenase